MKGVKLLIMMFWFVSQGFIIPLIGGDYPIIFVHGSNWTHYELRTWTNVNDYNKVLTLLVLLYNQAKELQDVKAFPLFRYFKSLCGGNPVFSTNYETDYEI